MATINPYKTIFISQPTGEGGVLIQNNFKTLADLDESKTTQIENITASYSLKTETQLVIDNLNSEIGARIQGDNTVKDTIFADGSLIYSSSISGSILRTQKDRNSDYINVKDFGAKGDGITDDALSVQKALNVLAERNGGTLLFPYGTYRIDTIPAGALTSLIGIPYYNDSKCLIIPKNVTIEGGGSTLALGNVASSPFGYLLNVQLLSFSGDSPNRVDIDVISANNATKSIVSSSTTGITAGMMVILGRKGTDNLGNATTPSAECSPCQFLTVSEVDGNTITFVEGFMHDYENVTGLNIEVLYGGLNNNIKIQNLTFTGGYTLITRTYNSELKSVKFIGNARMSFGTCQRVIIDDLYIQNIGGVSIESVCDIQIGKVTLEGNGNDIKTGGLFITDNCKGVHIAEIEARNWSKSALVMFYGIDATIDRINLYNCGTVLDSYAAGLSLGMPSLGAYATKSSARSERYQVRNVPNSKINIGSFNVYGPACVPLRIHDAKVFINTAYVEYSGTEDSYPFIIGQSGETRSDIINPNGGESSFYCNSWTCRSLNGTSRLPDFAGGYQGVIHGGLAFLSSPALSGDYTIVLDRSGIIKGEYGLPIYYMNPNSDITTPISNTVEQCIDNSILLSGAVGVNINSGTAVWSSNGLPEVLRNTCFKEYKDLSSTTGTADGTENYHPNTSTGVGPYTGTFDLTVPNEGVWNLDLQYVTYDNAHASIHKYLVTFSKANNTYHMSGCTQIAAQQIRTNANIINATISENIVTVSLSNVSIGQAGQLHVKWTKINNILKW